MDKRVTSPTVPRLHVNRPLILAIWVVIWVAYGRFDRIHYGDS